ncbi:unnamed protein product [Danaus chrysippus]|uniref:(African queen) hypothetical protein n=1 Tax=Danaus chrysippus TaxID=151541 RepID=A0A8J2QJM9_9NEOP|nr:unnamed protein product [Danaus chrysippus]
MSIFLALLAVVALATSAADCAPHGHSNIIHDLRTPENYSKERLSAESEFRKIRPLRHRVLHKLIPTEQRGAGLPAFRPTVEYEFDLIRSNDAR